MLDRQAHFLKQRDMKRAEILRQRKEKEEEEEKRMRDEKAAASKQRTGKFEHIRSRLHETAKKGGKRQNEVGVSGNKKSKWGKLRNTVRATAALKNNTKRRSKKKRSSASSASASVKNGKPSLLEMCKSMLNDQPAKPGAPSDTTDEAASLGDTAADIPAPPSTPLAPRTPCQSPKRPAQMVLQDDRKSEKAVADSALAANGTTSKKAAAVPENDAIEPTPSA